MQILSFKIFKVKTMSKISSFQMQILDQIFKPKCPKAVLLLGLTRIKWRNKHSFMKKIWAKQEWKCKTKMHQSIKAVPKSDTRQGCHLHFSWQAVVGIPQMLMIYYFLHASFQQGSGIAWAQLVLCAQLALWSLMQLGRSQYHSPKRFQGLQNLWPSLKPLFISNWLGN